MKSMIIQIPSCLQYKARLIIETRFENSSVRSKLGVRLILEFWELQCKIRGLTSEFFDSE